MFFLSSLKLWLVLFFALGVIEIVIVRKMACQATSPNPCCIEVNDFCECVMTEKNSSVSMSVKPNCNMVLEFKNDWREFGERIHGHIML